MTRVTRRAQIGGVVLVLVAVIQTGCNSCDRRSGTSHHFDGDESSECKNANDCVDLEPCREVACVAGRCSEAPLPTGTPCGDASACQRAPTCDGRGRCLPGEPIDIDDGNPCTEDSCDPTRGAVNEPIDIDDGDACTEDACDPRSGAITHESVDLDDGDDCTFDSCNPETGVSHARPEPKYTCAPTCGEGYHVASRRLSPGCPEDVLQSLCQPVCGDSLYTCESSCPPGYRPGTRHVTAHCGPDQPLTFCRKDH